MVTRGGILVLIKVDMAKHPNINPTLAMAFMKRLTPRAIYYQEHIMMNLVINILELIIKGVPIADTNNTFT